MVAEIFLLFIACLMPINFVLYTLKHVLRLFTSLLFPIQSSRQPSLLKLFFLLRSCFFGRSHTQQHCDFIPDSSNVHTFSVLPGPSGPSSTNTTLPSHPRLQTSYISSAHCVSSPSAPSTTPHVPDCFSIPTVSSSPLTPLGFFNGMLQVLEPGALNYYTLFYLILLTLFVSRNLNLIHLPLSGFLIPGFSAVRSDCTHSRSGICSPNTTHASGGVIIFVRQGLSFPELSTFFLSSLEPYSDYLGVNISLNNFSSLSFLNVYSPSVRSSPTDNRTDSFSLSILSSFRNLFIRGDLNCNYPLCDSKSTFDFRDEKVFNWVISSDFFPLNDPDIPTFLHCSSGSRSSPDIYFALSSLALSCSWEVLQNLSSDHLPILLSVYLYPIFRFNEVPHTSIFRKLVGMALPFTSTLTVLLQRNTGHFLFPPLVLPLLL